MKRSCVDYLIKKSILAGFALATFFSYTTVYAEDPSFEVSGWVPYWKSTAGVNDIIPRLGTFTEVNPFIYSVRQDGSLYANSDLSAPEWMTLKNAAHTAGVRFIPTIMWANADAMDEIFRDDAKRKAHVQSIMQTVYGYDLDGIDIDYEAKYARTRPYFSLFLKELYEAIGYDKWVMCTIEARTPLDSRYEKPEDIPPDIEYANDFAEINKYCDRVRIMAYDQGRYDLKLNKANSDPYVPVADRAWVEKVVRLAAEEIDRNKISIGIPTYGYEYDMFPALNGGGYTEYSRLWSFNPNYARDMGAKLGIEPVRNSAGELFLIYPASRAPEGAIPLPFATRVLSWSDAESVRQKTELAKELGVRGISIFKIDGGQDPGLYAALSPHQGMKFAQKEKNLASVLTAGGALEITGAPEGAGATQQGSPVSAPSTPPEPLFKLPLVDLNLGMRSEDVVLLQKFLNGNGFHVAESGAGSPGNETIMFGSATKAALTRFQKANGISPATGYYGPRTRAEMQKIAGSGTAPATAVSSGGVAASAFTRDIGVGTAGEDVRALQAYLNNKGFKIAESGPGSPGNETEKFGTLTHNALRSFQAAMGISPATGFFGPKTRAFIENGE
ncbi:peptidoglycan-binding protein [bacterium]|nr:peptidoglycan-binding protein [bacterium]